MIGWFGFFLLGGWFGFSRDRFPPECGWNLYKKILSITFNKVTREGTLKEGMDSLNKRLLQKTMRRIPLQMLRTTLEKWGRLTAQQQQSMDFTQTKLTLTEHLLDIFEVCGVFNSTMSTKYTLFFLVIVLYWLKARLLVSTLLGRLSVAQQPYTDVNIQAYDE